MSGLKIVFAGSPAVAVPSLRALAASRHELVGVITRKDAPLGRKRVLTPTPVADATEPGVALAKANRLADVADRVLALGADLGVIVAYGGLVREPLLSAPRLGWINLHFSLLPRWRGAAPVQHAIMAGDEVTGSSVFRLVEELDAGDVYAKAERPIGPDETAGEVLQSLAESGAGLLAGVVDALAEGRAHATPQQGEPTFAPKLTIDDGRIEWDRAAGLVYNRIRGTTPEPGAFTDVDGTRVKIIAAARARQDHGPLAPGRIVQLGDRVLIGTASEPIELVTVQPAGKRAMDATAWLRGFIGNAIAR